MLPAVVTAGNVIGLKLNDLYARRPEIKDAILRALRDKTGGAADLACEIKAIAGTISEVTGCTDQRTGLECDLHCEARPHFL